MVTGVPGYLREGSKYAGKKGSVEHLSFYDILTKMAGTSDAGKERLKALMTHHENFPIPGVLFHDGKS